jgi:hypothetical protein
MITLRAAILISSFAIGSVSLTYAAEQSAASDTPRATCESKAVGKNGKILAGAAKASFMKKCLADTCAATAVSKEGKPLFGAAKNSFMQRCEKTS